MYLSLLIFIHPYLSFLPDPSKESQSFSGNRLPLTFCASNLKCTINDNLVMSLLRQFVRNRKFYLIITRRVLTLRKSN